MSQRWWNTPFRTVQTNLREIDAGLDVEQTADAIQSFGANTWLISVGGIIANYPSKLACQTVNPVLGERESGDLVGDAVVAAHDRGMRLLGRMDFSKIDARRAEEHPEWCFVSPEGVPQTYNGYRSVCPSGDYYQQKMFDVIEEVMNGYDISGFFFNMMTFNEFDYSRAYWGVCHCAPCLEGFRAFAPGLEHPRSPESSGYARWRQFTAHVLDDLHARMTAHIHAIRPHVALIMGDKADITFHEANNAVGRALWHHHTAEQVSAARSGNQERPVFVNSAAFVDMPYRWAGEDPHRYAQYLVQTIATGAQPSLYLMGRIEDSKYEAVEAGAEVMRFHRDNERIYTDLRSDAKVALVRTSKPDAPDPQRRRAEFEGQYLALTEKHVPFDVVRQDRLSEMDPERYALVILPDLGELRPEEVKALEAVLAAGGGVVATGDSGWQQGSPQLGGDEPLAQQRAAFVTQESVRSLHVPVNDSGDLAPVVGGFHVLEPRPGAQVDWLAVGRALYGPPEKCYGHHPTSHPGWVAGRHGAGVLAYAPWRPGLTYRTIGLSAVRDSWVTKILTTSGESLQVRSSLPQQVQIVPGRNHEAAVVHLLNRTGDADQRFMPPVPLAEAALHLDVSWAVSGVRARVADQELEWRQSGRDLTVKTPPLGLFEVIEIK
ncbi:alpha-amylase family protein [Nesterenkonia xinjiangensis]|uniref:Beta-galactosidase trimerisation domain-containing protein n=1 Tax=Nesterenkonia xinjiangensis TaxID=225327 RepID=A0A7Z0GN62_9MICC|nr:alpha-amylase family protein [Nesterenkonia xinjiangensis]NYJ79076.1 hypothetical protein [Nesterenkonia xinjiangensis]